MANLPVPTMRTFVVGEYETASYFNANVRDAINYLLNLPIATVFQTAGQSLSSGVAAPINFDSTAVDSYGGHSNTVNPSRYTAQVAGWYLVGGNAPMANATAGTYRKVQLYLNGTAIAYATGAVPSPSASASAVTPTLSPTLIYMNVGDFVSLYAIADGAGVSVTPNSGNEAYMTILWAHA